jgi:hypothetical protein
MSAGDADELLMAALAGRSQFYMVLPATSALKPLLNYLDWFALLFRVRKTC